MDFETKEKKIMLKIPNSILYTKPLKQIPKGLIYKVPTNSSYRLFSTNDGSFVGKMYAYAKDCTNSSFYDVEPNGETFHIYSFEIFDEYKRKGWGEYFAQFAKNESYKQGCKGRTSLVAYNSDKSPHVFWWKQGFVTKDKDTNRLLDSYVQNNVSPWYMPAKDMFLPIEKYMKKPKPISTEPPTFWEKVGKVLKLLFGEIEI